jgi:uncharacterized protein (DUF1778 family)
MTKKTAILIRCTAEEAELIRQAAANERRTLSGFILNAVMNRIRIRAQMAGTQEQQQKAAPPAKRRSEAM